MFDRIAGVYDLMNAVMTAGMHQRWRERAVELARVGPGSRALDVATGTGDLAIELAEFRSTHAIRGVLLPDSGAVAENVYISFRDPRTQERLARVAIPEADGTFTMRNLRDQAYDLELVDFESRWEPVRIDGVRPGGAPVEVRLTPRR